MSVRVVVKLLMVALVLGLIPLASELWFIPLHRQGVAQPLLSPVNAIGRVLATPGVPIVEALGLRSESHTTTAVGRALLPAIVSSMIAAIAYFVLGGVLLHVWRRINHVGAGHAPPSAIRPKGEACLAPTDEHFSQHAIARPTRRNLLRGGAQAATASCAAVAAYSLGYEPNTLRITRLQIPIRDLPESLSGLRIAHVTDIHHCAWHTNAFLRAIVDTTNALDPDLVALTGDYVGGAGTLACHPYIEPVAKALSLLRPRIGSVATLGNHDWWEDGPRILAAFAANGIPTIDNKRLFITPQRALVGQALLPAIRNGRQECLPYSTGLCIAGVGDLWAHVCNFDRALGNLPPDMPRLLLSHNPDAAEEPGLLKSDHRVDLILSGHTHGGQIRLPLIGTPITNSKYGSKYAAGLVQGPRCPVFISRGIGTTALPVRLGVPPEIALLELHRA